MRKWLSTLLGSGFAIGFLALAGAAAAMAVLFLLFDTFSGEDPGAPRVADDAVITGETVVLEEELYSVTLNGIPAPFLNPADGQAVGYVFLDIAFEVRGNKARDAAETSLEFITTAFSERLKKEGAGMPDRPGAVDTPRLEATFRESAEGLIGKGTVGEVTIIVAGEE